MTSTEYTSHLLHTAMTETNVDGNGMCKNSMDNLEMVPDMKQNKCPSQIILQHPKVILSVTTAEMSQTDFVIVAKHHILFLNYVTKRNMFDVLC